MSDRRSEPGHEDWVTENEGRIRELAESDAVDAWVYQRLLDNIDGENNEEY